MEPQWYCYFDRTQDGPLSQGALARRFGERLVPLHALVWCAERWPDARWHPAREVPAFLSAATAPPLPVPKAIPVAAPPRAFAPRPPLQRPAAVLPPLTTSRPFQPGNIRVFRPPGSVPGPATPHGRFGGAGGAWRVGRAPAVTAPGARFWARLFDSGIGGLLLLNFILPFFPVLARAGYAIQLGAALLAWLVAEPFILAIFGFTPGKWLFGLRLQTAAGGRIGFMTAARRSVDVYLRGLGAGVPPFVLFALSASYDRLQREGITVWDQDAGVVVVRSGDGVLGWALLGVTLVILLLRFSSY